MSSLDLHLLKPHPPVAARLFARQATDLVGRVSPRLAWHPRLDAFLNGHSFPTASSLVESIGADRFPADGEAAVSWVRTLETLE